MAFVHLIGGASSWPCAILFALAFRDVIGWRGIFVVIGIATLIVWLLRFSLPESPRWLATHGKGDQALATLKRLGIAGPPAGVTLTTDIVSDTHSDPFAVVFGKYKRTMILAIVAFFFVYFVVYVVASWMPTLMGSRGFSVTKALTFTFGMTLAYPCSSAFMMYALDRFGRLKTCITALIAAAIVSVIFVNSANETMLLVVGFLMFFCIQTGTNSMVIYTTELFHQCARHRARNRIRGRSVRRHLGRLGDRVHPGLRHRRRIRGVVRGAGDRSGRGVLNGRRDQSQGARRHSAADGVTRPFGRVGYSALILANLMTFTHLSAASADYPTNTYAARITKPLTASVA